MKPLHDILLALRTRSSREVYRKQTKLQSLQRYWKKDMEKFGIRGLRIWKWVFDESLVKWEKSEWKESMKEKKWDFAQIPSSLAILYRRKWLEITIQRSSTVQNIISQKLCCNNCCQVAVLEELAWTANSVAVILKKSVWSDSECLGNSNSV